MNSAVVLSILDDVGLFKGVVPSGGVTDDSTLGLSGSLSMPLGSGETVRVYDGTTLLGTASVDSSGSAWTFTTAALPAGSHSFTARVADAAGNLSPAVTAYTVTKIGRAHV